MLNDSHTDVTTISANLKPDCLNALIHLRTLDVLLFISRIKLGSTATVHRQNRRHKNMFKTVRGSPSVQDNTYVDSKQQYKHMCTNKRLKYSRNALNKLDATVNKSRFFWREPQNHPRYSSRCLV